MAVQDPQTHEIGVGENPGGREVPAEQIYSFPALDHFPRRKASIELDSLPMLSERVAGVMKNFSWKGLDRPIHHHRFVHQGALPLSSPPVKEAELAVGVPAGVENPPAKITGAAGEPVAGGGRRSGKLIRDFPQLEGSLGVGVEFFVGVQAQDPIVPRLLGSEILLRGKALLRADKDARP